MWSEACEMLERAERMHRQFFQVRSEARRGPSWEPPVDILETGDGLNILVALPGVEARAIDVLIDGDTVVVRGNRPLPALAEGCVIHRLEIPHGHFERSIRLNGGGPLELTHRELLNGCLRLVFRKLR
jgi:HSP20 family molecular chaperone IbpA